MIKCMAKTKRWFRLEEVDIPTCKDGGTIHIIGQAPKDRPYVTIRITGIEDRTICIYDKDLERFALNILKALKSKKLKP